MPNNKIKFVKQQHARGCVPACLSMVLGKPYAKVIADFHNDFDVEGLASTQISDYLGEHGCSVVYKSILNYCHKDFARKYMLTPFAPIHLVSVQCRADSEGFHCIVMDARGKLVDPDGWSDAKLRGVYSVNEVWGIWKDKPALAK